MASPWGFILRSRESKRSIFRALPGRFYQFKPRKIINGCVSPPSANRAHCTPQAQRPPNCTLYILLIRRNALRAEILHSALIVHVWLFPWWKLVIICFMSWFTKLCRSQERGFCLQTLLVVIVVWQTKTSPGKTKGLQSTFVWLVCFVVCHGYISTQEWEWGNYSAGSCWCCGPLCNLGVGGMGKKCPCGRSKIIVGLCFGFVVIWHVVLVELLRLWESLPNAMI